MVKIPPQKGFNVFPNTTTVAMTLPVNSALINSCLFVYVGLVRFNAYCLLRSIKCVIVTILMKPVIPMNLFENLYIANGEANMNQITVLVSNEKTI